MKKIIFISLLLLIPFCCNSRTKTVIIPDNGVYIFTIDGSFIVRSEWDNSATPLGIALITDNTKALISLNEPYDDIEWGPSGIVDGVITTEKNNANNKPGKAYNDFAGYNNTKLILSALTPNTNEAVSVAASYKFSNDITGYLPALGELNDMIKHIEEIQDALAAIGATPIYRVSYWSSSQHYLNYRAWAWSIGEGFPFAMLRNDHTPLSHIWINHCRVRPFAKIPQTIEYDDKEDEKEYVDLGLPSGTLWAKCNIGASNFYDYGTYFKWSQNLAENTLGGHWCTPTKKDRDELVKYCTYSVETINGIKGAKYTGSNGNYIFFPFAGYKQGESGPYRVGEGGQYWTSTPYGSGNSEHWVLAANYNTQKDDGAYYWPLYSFGFPVRPVIHTNNSDRIEKPTITFEDNTLYFNSNNTNAQYFYTLQANDNVSSFKEAENGNVTLTGSYYVTVYAKTNNETSEATTETFNFPFIKEVEKEIIKEVPVEIIKEVPVEVIVEKEVIKEVHDSIYIYDDTHSDIVLPTGEKLRINIVEGIINIENIPSNSMVYVYSTSGEILEIRKVYNNNILLQLPRNNTYIIKVIGQTIKIKI